MLYVTPHGLPHRLGQCFTERASQITLSGFGFVVVNLLTMFWYNPNLNEDMPSWVYVSWAIGLFLYQTFDAVDGSQAYARPKEKVYYHH